MPGRPSARPPTSRPRRSTTCASSSRGTTIRRTRRWRSPATSRRPRRSTWPRSVSATFPAGLPCAPVVGPAGRRARAAHRARGSRGPAAPVPGVADAAALCRRRRGTGSRGRLHRQWPHVAPVSAPDPRPARRDRNHGGAQSSRELGSVFQIVATAAPGVPLRDVHAAILEELEALRRSRPGRGRPGARPRPGRGGVRLSRAVARRVRRPRRSAERLQRLSGPAGFVRRRPGALRRRHARSPSRPRLRAGSIPPAPPCCPSCRQRRRREPGACDRIVSCFPPSVPRRRGVSRRATGASWPTACASGRSATRPFPPSPLSLVMDGGTAGDPADRPGLASLVGGAGDGGRGRARRDRDGRCPRAHRRALSRRARRRRRRSVTLTTLAGTSRPRSICSPTSCGGRS